MMDSTVRDSVIDEADIQKVLDYYSPIKGLKIDVKKHDQENFWTYTCQSSRSPAQHQSNIQRGERQQTASSHTPVGGPVDYDALQRAPSRRPAPPSLSHPNRNVATTKAGISGGLGDALFKLALHRDNNTPTAENSDPYALFPKPPAGPTTPIGSPVDYEAILRAPKIHHHKAHNVTAAGPSNSSLDEDDPTASIAPFKWSFNRETLQLAPNKPRLTVDTYLACLTPTRAGATSSDDKATKVYALFPAPTSNPSTPVGGGGPVDYESLLRAPGRRVHLATPPARNSSTVQDARGVNGEEVDSGANADRVIGRLRRPRFKPVRRRTVNSPVENPSELVDNMTTVNAFAGVRAPPPRVASVSGAATLPEHFQIFIDPGGEMGIDGPPRRAQ
jgi:hypothetical protein